MGANHFINSCDPKAIAAAANSFDFILSTVAVGLDWNSYVMALRPRGKLHFVGVCTESNFYPSFPLDTGSTVD